VNRQEDRPISGVISVNHSFSVCTL